MDSLRAWSVWTSLCIVALSLQGCDIIVPRHDVGNWRGKENYVFSYQFVPPGEKDDAATLNSCMSKAMAPAAKCNGHGHCRQWRTSPVEDTRDFEDNPLFFCECDAVWADPECRTRRKSQRVAYILSMFFGFVGADQWYLGFWRRATLKLMTCGGCGLWWLFDMVRIGSSPVYAFNTYRVANDLAYWQYLISLIAFLVFFAFSTGITSIMWHRLHKSREILLLKAEEKYMEQERLNEQAAFADEGYASLSRGPSAASVPVMHGNPSLRQSGASMPMMHNSLARGQSGASMASMQSSFARGQSGTSMPMVHNSLARGQSGASMPMVHNSIARGQSGASMPISMHSGSTSRKNVYRLA